MKKMKISIVVDTPSSWMNQYAKEFVNILRIKRYEVVFCNRHKKIKKGEIAIFLSCEKIVTPRILKRNKHNVIVHESDLPKGKGWSPTTWQILEGKNRIPITLLEAANRVDSGQIYFKGYIHLNGNELIDEIRRKQAKKTFELISKFIKKYPNIIGVPQNGKESLYRRRTPKDSKLDIDKTIKKQINLLRVVDNDRYPAFFYYKGHKYILKISKEK